MKLRRLGANCTEVSIPGKISVLFSYDTPVAAFVVGQGYIRSAVKYSTTTSRHINQWIGANKFKTVEQSEIDFILNSMEK
jgi:hypothetical protein